MLRIIGFTSAALADLALAAACALGCYDLFVKLDSFPNCGVSQWNCSQEMNIAFAFAVLATLGLVAAGVYLLRRAYQAWRRRRQERRRGCRFERRYGSATMVVFIGFTTVVAVTFGSAFATRSNEVMTFWGIVLVLIGFFLNSLRELLWGYEVRVG